MKTLKEMIENKLGLEKQLLSLNEEIEKKVIADHAEYRIGDVAPHNYRGGGEMIVTEIRQHHFQNKITGEYSISLYYSGNGIKKNGETGTMKCTNFGNRDDYPRFQIKDWT